MFDWETFRGLKELYAGLFGPVDYHAEHDHHHVRARTSELRQVLKLAKRDLGYLLLNDVATVPLAEGGWRVTYHLYQLENHQRLQVHVRLGPGERLPEVGDVFPSSGRAQAEVVSAMEGQRLEVTPLAFPPLPSNPNLSEAPYPEELRQWYLFDLLHPVTRGQGELVVEVEEGRVRRSWYQTGYWRRGRSEEAQGRALARVRPLLDGLCPEAAALTGVAWAKTVEDFFLWRVPERAQAVRMLFMELARCHHHFAVLGRLAADLGQDEGMQVCREAMERLRSLFSLYGGSRMGTGVALFGGLPHDLPPGWVQECAGTLAGVREGVVLYQRLVLRNPLCQRRLRVAGLSSQAALDWGLTGPALRAAGVNFDLRKSRPFYFYPDIDFDVPVGMYGDAHDRGHVLCEEIHQSGRILGQVLDNLPLGPVMSDIAGLAELNRGTLPAETWREWWRQASRPSGTQWTALEGANGELGIHLELRPDADGVGHLRLKHNAGLLAQALPEFLQGCPVAQVGPALTSLDIAASAVDR